MAKTISFDGFFSRAAALLTAIWLSGCGLSDAPPCPLPAESASAPSAGCFAVKNGALLVVQGRNGTLSPPGGSSRTGESARCTAFRETWEETGLRLRPERLLAEFDTGFQLFFCAHHSDSGAIDPPPRFEIQQAFYLAAEDFDQWRWRYPGQEKVLAKKLRALAAKPSSGASIAPADHATPAPHPAAPETR
ncbi:MAG: NUDIX hydrolase [Pseudomonadota bacterium]